MRSPNHNRVARHDRGRVKTDLARHRVEVLVHVLFQIDDTVSPKPLYPPTGTCVEQHQLIPRCDVDDLPVPAIVAIRKTATREPARGGLATRAFIKSVHPSSSPVPASTATTDRRVPTVEYTTPPIMSGVDWNLYSGCGPKLSVLKRQATSSVLKLSAVDLVECVSACWRGRRRRTATHPAHALAVRPPAWSRR